MSFSSNLKLKMEEKQITQKELAMKIGKGKSSVSQYLSGRNVPKESVQKQIAEVLDCTVEFLNGDAEEQPTTGKITVAECAKRLGKSAQFVRIGLQQGVFPFGFAVKNKSMYSYHISPKKLEEYIG